MPTIRPAATNALLYLAETQNHHLYVASFAYSGHELVAALEPTQGAKWDVQHLDVEEKEEEIDRRSSPRRTSWQRSRG